MDIKETIIKIRKLASIPMKTEQETRRVEIIILKFKTPEIEVDCVRKIIENTDWPYKLNVYDNRLNTANTARIWNKLVKDATCDYVMFIDSDAFVPKTTPCWLTRMMESIDKADVVIPVSDNCGGANQKVLGAEKYPSEVINKGIWSGFCWLFRKTLFDKLQQDETFYGYGSDSEFAHRMLKMGLKTIMRPDVFVKHLGGYSFKKAKETGGLEWGEDKLYARTLYELRTR
jgi:predicted glycosyltransferase involved in capsule biosynthesis